MDSPNERRTNASPFPNIGISRSLSLAKYDGFFSAIFATLTGGAFLTGFALALGANEFHIGIIAAIPLCANLFQFLGSYLVSQNSQRKPICIKSSAVGRGSWILMALLPFSLRWLSPAQSVLLFLVILAFSHMFIAIASVSWLSWISDIVPETRRGRFFGERNMIIGIAVMSFSLLGGKLLDTLDNGTSGFQILFILAVLAGANALTYVGKMPEPNRLRPLAVTQYTMTLSRPFRNPNFRRLLLFTMIWSFGVNLAAPFFVVYKLKDLHLTYTFITFLISVTTLFDLLGMRFWGVLTDKVGNRPVMLLCSLFAAFLPFGWLWTSNHSWSIIVLLPFLQIVAGISWAGMNLASVNILFRLAPKDEDTTYFAAYSSINGLFAALGCFLGSALAFTADGWNLDLFLVNITGLKVVFLVSWIVRCIAIPLLRRVNEPKGLSFIKAVQVLRNVRSINSSQGFSPYLHYFVRAVEKSRSRLRNHVR